MRARCLAELLGTRAAFNTCEFLLCVAQSWTRSAACQPPRNVWNYDEAFAGHVIWRTIGHAVKPRTLPSRPPYIGPYTPPTPRFGAKEQAEYNAVVHSWMDNLWSGVERSVQARGRRFRCRTIVDGVCPATRSMGLRDLIVRT